MGSRRKGAEGRARLLVEPQDFTPQSREIVRLVFEAELERKQADQAVACVLIAVTASGKIRSTAVNVEPEHIEPLLKENRLIARSLEEFRDKIQAQKAPVISLVKR